MLPAAAVITMADIVISSVRVYNVEANGELTPKHQNPVELQITTSQQDVHIKVKASESGECVCMCVVGETE